MGPSGKRVCECAFYLCKRGMTVNGANGRAALAAITHPWVRSGHACPGGDARGREGHGNRMQILIMCAKLFSKDKCRI